MRTSPSGYGARVGLDSAEPPPLSQGGGTIAGLAVLGGCRVGVITDNSESSLLDSSNHCFWRLRWSLGPSRVSISLIRKCCCVLSWPKHALHTLLFWPHR